MRVTLSWFVVTLSLAAAPGVALAGPAAGGDASAPAATSRGPTLLTDAAMSKITGAGDGIAYVPTILPLGCDLDVPNCSVGAIQSSSVGVTFTPDPLYPPSPCNRLGGACTEISLIGGPLN